MATETRNGTPDAGGSGQMVRIAGVVVLYRPVTEVLKCIRSYADDVEALYVIDNTEEPDQDLTRNIKQIRNVTYISMATNVGIATALNTGAARAIDDGYTHLFMMDQDSVAGPGLLDGFREYLSTHADDRFGILAPRNKFRNYDYPVETQPVKEIEHAITAGTLLDLSAYQAVGPFKDSFFIDAVDFEYSLRLRARGFRLVQINALTLHQALGNLVQRKVFFRTVAVYHHDPLRVYYRVRNSLATARMYLGVFTAWSVREIVITMNAVVKILLFESMKGEKLLMAWRGMIHFFRRRGGSYTDAMAGRSRLF